MQTVAVAQNFTCGAKPYKFWKAGAGAKNF